ncbi:potassium channel family protein [Pseudonocardia kujensis]|uniref:potassium channel family protein n=1 Tax=Pseudonocardia kujensis TaxID=1128675 RepID=UPI001E572C13|nr:potassium channel family protein [Pseudonocardia kujensis]MCE0764407.1 potassium channel family protein [Pseudonocardia kujensis]
MSTPMPGLAAARLTPREVILAGLSGLATVAFLVALYYVLPLSVKPGGITLMILLLGLAGIAGLIIWQVRVIERAPYPGLRAFGTLVLVVPVFLLLFSAGYFLASQADPAAFTEPLTRTDALYFTVTVFSTVGFGDIAPVAPALRIVVTVQMVADLLVLGLVLKAILDAVSRGLERRRSA